MSIHCRNFECSELQRLYQNNMKQQEEFCSKLNEKHKLQISEYSEKLAKFEEKAKIIVSENNELKKKLSALSSRGDIKKIEKEPTKPQEKNVKQADDLISKYVKELRELKSQIWNSSEKLAEEEEKGKLLNLENLELKNKLTNFEKVFEKEKELLLQKQSGFSTKSLEEKKSLELRCLKLSTQISDFEKVLFFEREKFETERKSFSKRNGELSLKISDLEKELDILSKENEKMKVEGFRTKCLKDDFAKERKTFQTEISKLTKRLSELTTESLKKQKVKSDSKIFVKSNNFSKDQIRPSNLFYNSRVDNKDNPSFKKVKMEWRVKGTTPAPKSPVSVKSDKNNKAFHAKPFVKTDRVYSVNKLINLSAQKLCCSYCGTSDFVRKDHAQYWHGTYSIPGPHRASNRKGSIKGWIPKSF